MPTVPTPARRRLLFACLYFSEGAPIGYVWWALPVRLRDAGMPVDQVTAITSLLVLPWALKFLWAPLVDAVRTPVWGLRSWILSAQFLMALPLLALIWVDLASAVGLVTTLLVIHAVCAATQDVAIDALAIRTTPPEERGTINAWMQGGMLCARGIFGGASLWAEKYIGAGAVLVCLVLAVWGSGVLLLLMGPMDTRPTTRGGLGTSLRAIGHALARAFGRRTTWLGLGFALLGGAAFEAVGSVGGVMLRDRGHSTELVGLFFAAPVLAVTIAGGFVGGRLADRFGRARAAGWSVVLTALVVAGLAAIVALLPPGGSAGMLSPEILGLTAVYAMVGATTATSYAVFMDLTDPAIGATQFSAFMGATNLCESWSAKMCGRVASASGYPAAWLLGAVISLAAVPILWAIGRSLRRSAAFGGEPVKRPATGP